MVAAAVARRRNSIEGLIWVMEVYNSTVIMPVDFLEILQIS